MLRAHTSAHQRDLIASGLDAFLAIGDVYRRDEIDRTHYPVFHQVEGVRLLTKDQLFKNQADSLDLFETCSAASKLDIDNKQSCHSMETAKILEHELKRTLEGMVANIFQEKLEFRWVSPESPDGFVLLRTQSELFTFGNYGVSLLCWIRMIFLRIASVVRIESARVM